MNESLDFYVAEVRLRFFCASGKHELGRVIGSDASAYPEVGRLPDENRWSDGQGNIVLQKRGLLVIAEGEDAPPLAIEGRCRACIRAGTSRSTPRLSWPKVLERLYSARDQGARDTKIDMTW